jgi:hypothetical protein
MAISYRDTHQFGCSYIRCDFGDDRTNRLNEAHGVFLNFAKRYHDIRVAAHSLDNRVKTEPSPLDEGDAHQIYFQLFGLMYDEINAYQNNFVEKEVVVEWLAWQMYDYTGGEFKIGGVSYDNGWQWWLTTPAKHHQYTPMLKKIFTCKDKECVKDAIER